MPYKLHVISHTHWDREWYLPFEQHRLRLVDLVDLLLDIFATEPDYKHFHLDGQAIVLEDYLAVRPEREAELRKAAKGGKLSLGPWYVLQDEFLTSGEANVRNMMAGMKAARRFGEPCLVGYLPDSFGNLSQMPQLLRGFGIDNAVFGRGVNRYNAAQVTAERAAGDCSRGADGETQGVSVSPADPGEMAGETPAPRAEPAPCDTPDPHLTGFKSELTWRSPDGSEVLGVFMANWYSNAMDIPADPDEAVEFMVARRDATAAFATTSQLLMMNGCDHTPTRRDVGRVIKSLKGKLGDDKIKHSTFEAYLEDLRAEVGDLQVHEGEMRSEYTEGWGTLANTLSARLYQKRANFECQALYERWAEPLSAFAWAATKGRFAYPGDPLWYGWRTLMQNHPHDSICGCSCDEVHREMDTRFDKAREVGNALVSRAASALTPEVDTSWVAEGSVPAVVFNPLPQARTETVRLVVDFPEETELADIEVVASGGQCVGSRIVKDHGVVWDYWLPEDRFRVPFNARRLTIEIIATDVPGCGYATYGVAPLAQSGRKGEEPAKGEWPEGASGVLENENLRVVIAHDGSLTVTDKHSGAEFSGLNVYEDTGDVGDEYVYRAPADDVAITTTDEPAHVALFRRATGDQVAETTQWLMVPRRAAGKRTRTDEVIIATQLFLGAEAKALEVYVTIGNTATDHRIRALFPTHVDTAVALADGQFDIVQRRIVPAATWTNPNNAQPQQAFVDVSDAHCGLTVANRGLPEYEVLRDGANTIALTLLRCVGQIGDWGAFPTPEAQCLGEQRAAYAIIPHGGRISHPGPDGPAALAYAFAYPMWATQVLARSDDGGRDARPTRHSCPSALPATASLIALDPANVVLSTIKKAEDRDSLVMRVYNPFETAQKVALACVWPIAEAHLVNLAEEREEALEVADGGVKLEIGAKKIVTVELVVG